MINIETIITLVQQLGFPIGMCLLLFWQNTKESERHKEETKQFTEALNNNTLAIQKLHDRISTEIDPKGDNNG